VLYIFGGISGKNGFGWEAFGYWLYVHATLCLTAFPHIWIFLGTLWVKSLSCNGCSYWCDGWSCFGLRQEDKFECKLFKSCTPEIVLVCISILLVVTNFFFPSK
jgi:hypothetical protein